MTIAHDASDRTITSVTTHLLSSDWAAADPGWTGGGDVKSTALIEVHTADGLSGLGETILGYFVPEAVPALVEYYKPLLLGQDASRISSLWRRMYESSKWWGRSGMALSAISGIDIALWDLLGKRLGVPVHTLLGGRARDAVRLYASVGESPWPARAAAEKVKRYVDAGFTAVKIGQFYDNQFTWDALRGGSLLRPSTVDLATQEAEKFTCIRDVVGTDVDLIVHNHMGSQIPTPMNLSEAVRVAQALEPLGLLFQEEPLPYEDPAGYAELRTRTTLPVAGGEMLSGLHEFRSFIEIGALDIIQPDVSFAGGITGLREILALARANHVRVTLHMGGSFGPAFAAGLHMSLAHQDAFILEFLPAASSALGAICDFPLGLVDGCIAAPHRPGLGISLTSEVLAAFPFVPGSGERG